MTADPTPWTDAIRRKFAQVRGVIELACAEIRHTPIQSALSILAVALAVLAVTLLAGTGFGVLETGQQKFANADRDLWIADSGVEVSSSGLENPIVDSHTVAATAKRHDAVRTAAPLAFHMTYLRADGETDPVTGVGLPNTHGNVNLDEGEGFSQGDVHYANGSYDGPRTDEVIVDRSTADALGLEVGETVTVAASRDGEGREMTVVGISSTYSKFLGSSTAVLPLSELQRLAGTTGSDRATFVAVTVADGADQGAVRQDLAEEFHQYQVRTNREQLEAMLGSRALLLASALAVVILAVLIGSAIMLNVLVLSVFQQTDELTALHALGLSRGTLIGTVLTRSIILGGVGAAIGLLLTPVLGVALDVGAARLVGFSNIVRVTPSVYLLGGGVAAAISLFGSLAVGWYTTTTLEFSTLTRN
jgi:putative ABC transport system permease protein